jgi:phosphatidylserine/phosphatidylglycerophosphate/cardiolipin synthase-like enzyme
MCIRSRTSFDREERHTDQLGPVHRIIHSRSVAYEVPKLLQSLFGAQLIEPSPVLWIISPWISNVPLLDNRANEFRAVAPTWPQSRIRLDKVLARLLSEGTQVHIVTRPSRPGSATDVTDQFLRSLEQETAWEGCPLNVVRDQEATQHQKGILTEDFYLRGSMNLTFNGIQHNDEQVDYTTDPEVIGRARSEFKERWLEPES